MFYICTAFVYILLVVVELKMTFVDSNLSSFHDVLCDTVSSYSLFLYLCFMNKRSLTFDPRLALLFFYSFQWSMTILNLSSDSTEKEIFEYKIFLDIFILLSFWGQNQDSLSKYLKFVDLLIYAKYSALLVSKFRCEFIYNNFPCEWIHKFKQKVEKYSLNF